MATSSEMAAFAKTSATAQLQHRVRRFCVALCAGRIDRFSAPVKSGRHSTTSDAHRAPRGRRVCVSPTRLLSDADDRLADTLLDSWPARLGTLRLGALRLGALRLGAFVGRVFNAPNPLSEGPVADHRDQLLDAVTEFLAVIDQPATLLIARQR
jgi:hypothetical protein